MSTRTITMLAAAMVWTAAVSAQDETPATVREVMLVMVMPASDAFFKAAAEFEAPSDEGWQALAEQAQVLETSGRLMLTDALAREGDGWAAMAQAQVDVAGQLAEAVAAHDFNRLVELNDPLYETCVNCHGQFMEP